MAHTPTVYRLVVVDPNSSNPFTPGDTTVDDDHLWVTSFRDPTEHNYITTPPSDDGDKLDILTGLLDDAACQIGVSDAGGYVLGFLANATTARQRFSGLESYVEKTSDDGTTWLLVRHGFVTDVEVPRAQEFLFTVGGARKRERSMTVAKLLRGMSDPDNGSSVNSGFYPFFPTVIIGGPVFRGLPGGYQDSHALPLFQVADRQVSATFGWISIQWVAGPLPPFFAGTTSEPLDANGGINTTNDVLYGYNHQAGQTADVEAINTMAAPFYVDSHRLRSDPPTGEKLRGSFPDLAVYLYEAAAPQNLLYTQGALGSYTNSQGTTVTNQSGRNFMRPNRSIFIPWDEDDFGTTPTVGTLFAVAVVPRVMSERFPLFYAAHPITVLDAALSAIGRTLDGASATAAVQVIGEEHYAFGFLTDPKQKVMDWLTQLGAVWGFALVLDDDSTDFKVVMTRDRYDGSVLDAITDDDLRASGGPTFKNPASSRRSRVRATLTQFVKWHPSMDVDRTFSDIIPFETPFEVTAEGVDEDDQIIDITLTGRPMIQSPLSNAVAPTPIGLDNVVEAIARRLLERHADGTPEYTFALTATSLVNPTMAELVSMATSHLPNAQTGGASRGGARPGRVVERTRAPSGDTLTLIDEGTGVQFDAQSVDITDFETYAPDDKNFAAVTIAGISSLGEPAFIDIYVGIKPAGTTTAPTSRGMLVNTSAVDPANGDSIFQPIGPLPSGGPLWWVRIEVWKEGFYPSTSSAWWSLNGANTPPPTAPTPTGTISALTIADIGTDYAVLTWTNTNTTEPIRVSYKLDADANYTYLAVIPPGSVTFTVPSLIPNTAYDFQVELIDSFTQAVYVSLTVSGTTDAGSPTLVLYTPINPRAYSGTNLILGVVGLMVEPVFNTVHEVEFEMTPETAVGSGIPDGWPSDVSPGAGSETQFYPVNSATPGIAGSVDVISAHYVANDGRLRFFRARARKVVGGGTVITSAWTVVLSVMPWTVSVPTPPPGAGSLVDGGTATDTGPNQIDGGANVATDTYSGPPLEGGSA